LAGSASASSETALPQAASNSKPAKLSTSQVCRLVHVRINTSFVEPEVSIE
jgi:hypothetical protein